MIRAEELEYQIYNSSGKKIWSVLFHIVVLRSEKAVNQQELTAFYFFDVLGYEIFRNYGFGYSLITLKPYNLITLKP